MHRFKVFRTAACPVDVISFLDTDATQVIFKVSRQNNCRTATGRTTTYLLLRGTVNNAARGTIVVLIRLLWALVSPFVAAAPPQARFSGFDRCRSGTGSTDYKEPALPIRKQAASTIWRKSVLERSSLERLD